MALTNGPFNRALLGVRYSTFKEELRQRQYGKCCYCEKICENAGNDLEHYRPASKYWWLAWTWENLLFACPNCNRWGKSDEFPIVDEATRLVPEALPPGAEQALLIDPATEDPIEYIQFVFNVQSDRWLPRPRGANPKGAETIRVLKLDRPALLEHFSNHVDSYIKPDVEHLTDLMSDGDEHRVASFWSTIHKRYLSRRSYYAALSYDALDVLVPTADRTHWGLTLIRPA